MRLNCSNLCSTCETSPVKIFKYNQNRCESLPLAYEIAGRLWFHRCVCSQGTGISGTVSLWGGGGYSPQEVGMSGGTHPPGHTIPVLSTHQGRRYIQGVNTHPLDTWDTTRYDQQAGGEHPT